MNNNEIRLWIARTVRYLSTLFLIWFGVYRETGIWTAVTFLLVAVNIEIEVIWNERRWRCG